MGDIGAPELIIILVIIIVLFGPGRLQGAGKALGEAIRGFRQAIRDEEAPTGQEAPAADESSTPR
jgi:sec-independent protein translocase protein TatA